MLLFFTDCFLGKFPLEISREIGRFFYQFAPENPSKFDCFPLKHREISEALCLRQENFFYDAD